MANTNIQLFNEANTTEKTYNDSEYTAATQRQNGVSPGIAVSRMHNKMFLQFSAVAKGIANFIVNHGHDCLDTDVEGITEGLGVAVSDLMASANYATKSYVDSALQGLSVKFPAKVATTANIALTGVQTIDGVSVVAGDRVLVKNQTAGAANGIYIVAAGTWERTEDANTSAELVSAYVMVSQGTVNINSAWVMSTINVTLETTALVWSQFQNASNITASNGLKRTGNDISIDWDKIYPIGSIYLSVLNTSPAILFGGTWEALSEGKMLMAQGTTYTAGSTGGEATHTLTINEIPSHTHTFGGSNNDTGSNGIDLEGNREMTRTVEVNTGSTGGGSAHNNLPPYLAIYMWKRTA